MKNYKSIFAVVLITMLSVGGILFRTNKAEACEERVNGYPHLLMIECSGTWMEWNPDEGCYDTIEMQGCEDADDTCGDS